MCLFVNDCPPNAPDVHMELQEVRVAAFHAMHCQLQVHRRGVGTEQHF